VSMQENGNLTVKVIDDAITKVAVVDSNAPIINDEQSALDFAVSIEYEYGCRNIAVHKSVVTEDFLTSLQELRVLSCKNSSHTAFVLQ